MRLDKFLKVTRIIKRRTVAKELADNGNIVVNGDVKKSSYDVKKGDIFEIKYFNKNIKVKVLDLPPESLKKEFIDDYIRRKDLTLKDIDLKIGLLDADGVDKRTALFKAGTEPIEYEGKFKGGITY